VPQIQEDLPQEKEDNAVEPEKKKAALKAILADYNTRFGSNHTVGEFDLYYQDVQKRIKDQQWPNSDQPHTQKIDITIVVDMLLTGFDSKYLNTLYVDKNLKYHGLFDVVDEEQGGVICIKIIVASGSEKPYAKRKYGLTEKGCFIRIGTAAEPMPAAMIEKLFASRTRNSIGKIKSHRQTLSFEQLRIYYEEKRKPLNKQFRTNLELTTEDGSLNYAAYLLADENGLSIKVAKGRREQRLWNPIALREAVINAIVHNDYTREVPPKFELFADRIEITSAGPLPEGLSEAEFFEGYSIPRNKELMRIFKELSSQLFESFSGVRLSQLKHSQQTQQPPPKIPPHRKRTELTEMNHPTLQRMIFDGEQLGDLMAPLGLAWKARTQKELALMDELVPLLKKRAQGRDISGLNAYE